VAIVPKSISNSYAIEICQLLEFAKSLNVLAKEKKVYLQVFGIFNLAFTKIVDPTLFYGNLLSWRQIFYSRALRPSPFGLRPSPQSIDLCRPWPFGGDRNCRSSPFVRCCLVHVALRTFLLRFVSPIALRRLLLGARRGKCTRFFSRGCCFDSISVPGVHRMDSRLPNIDSSRRSIISKVNLCFVDEYFRRDHICFVRCSQLRNCSQLRQRRATRSRRRRQLDDESSDDDDFFMFTAAAIVQMFAKKKEDMVVRSLAISSSIVIEKPAIGGCIKIIWRTIRRMVLIYSVGGCCFSP